MLPGCGYKHRHNRKCSMINKKSRSLKMKVYVSKTILDSSNLILFKFRTVSSRSQIHREDG